MHYRESAIPLGQIVFEDRTFHLTTKTDTADLAASLAQIGLLNPPILIEKNKRLIIVAGFRRIAACADLKWATIQARVAPAQTTNYECAQIAISSNALERPLNLIEQSRAIRLLWEHAPEDSDFLQTAAILGLPRNSTIVKKIKKLAGLQPVIQDAILSGALPLAMALELGSLDNHTGPLLAGLFSDLKLSLNKQREIVTLVKEIAKREGVPLQAILSEDSIREACFAKDLDRAQKAHHIRTYLKRRRYPSINAAELLFKDHLNKLALTPEIRLAPPRDFEGTNFTLSMSIRCLSDLDDLQAALARIRQHPSLQAILDKKF